MMPPVSVCHQLSWIGCPKASDSPHHDFRVQRLAHAGEAEGRQVVTLRSVGCLS